MARCCWTVGSSSGLDYTAETNMKIENMNATIMRKYDSHFHFAMTLRTNEKSFPWMTSGKKMASPTNAYYLFPLSQTALVVHSDCKVNVATKLGS